MKKSNMVRGYRVASIGVALLIGMASWAQDESELNRSVTVERDFQPEIQAAGKVATKPEIVETTIEPAEVHYSDYTVTVTPQATIDPLLSQPTRFEAGHKYNGYVRGALGHPNTLFDMEYRLNDGKNSILDVYAHHKAEWGLATLSRTKVGLNFTHTYSTCNLYFGVNGGNVYYHKYGHFYNYHITPGMWASNETAYPRPYTIGDKDKTNLWTAEAFIGVASNAKQDVQYKVQTGYALFAKPGAVAEHQVRTLAMIDWHSDVHHVGAKVYVQNNFLQLGSLGNAISKLLYNGRHNLRIEPYYAYKGSRVSVHAGVNLDVNIGIGKNALSATDNISFAPSPHINFEAQIAKNWLTFYADVMGNHGLGSLQSFMEANRYRIIHDGIITHHVTAYTPADGEVGFHIRPHRDLLVEIHGGYAYMMNQINLVATADNSVSYKAAMPAAVNLLPGDFAYFFGNYGRGKVGGQVNYHYQDIVRVNLHGDYYLWRAFKQEAIPYAFATSNAAIDAVNAGTSTTVYDRANWQLGLRIDGRIDKNWSLYSDNHFMGSRLALANDGEHVLKPVIDLNLGVQYDMWVGSKGGTRKMKGDGAIVLRPEPKPNLSFFFQLNNWLHRKNEMYYGYRSQGINFLLGATYRF